MSRSIARLFVATLIGCSFGIVEAHEVRPAYLRIELTDSQDAADAEQTSYNVLWKAPLAVANARLRPVFPAHCIEVSLNLDQVVGSVLTQQFRLDCKPNLWGSKISIAGLQLGVTEVMLQASLSSDETITQILKPNNPSVYLTEANASIWSYLILGIEHLVFGIDHILFVIMLMFFIKDPMNLIKTVTSFTVAHSITLGLSVLDVVHLSQKPVEAVIALSILVLALAKLRENRSSLSQDSLIHDRTWIVAFIFGLLHGFGFAGALIDIGLPRENLLMSLFLFNLGVEIGQLLVIAVGLVVIAASRRVWYEAPTWIVRIPLYVTGSTSAYWLIERSTGLYV